MSANEEMMSPRNLQSAVAETQSGPQNTFLLVVKNFSAVWWTVAMDTGVLGIILRLFPFPSGWTKTCGIVMFVLSFVFVCIFSIITVLQWTLFFKETWQHLHDAEEIALQACPAIAWLTITTQLQLICAESWGNTFTTLSYASWWIELVWTFTVCVVLYLYLIEVPSQAAVDRLLPTAVFVPIVANLTAANAAGIIVNNGVGKASITDALAVPMIIVSFLLVGFALSVGYIMYAIYTHRLMTSGWPSALRLPGLILTIGTCGQGASALLQLGRAADSHQGFADYARGFFLQKDTASIIRPVCVLLAMLLVGFAIFWMCVAYYAILSGLVRRQIHPSLFWWSSIFPVGTVVTALSDLGADMDSLVCKVLATVLFTFLVCIYVVNTLFTVPMTLSGELLGLPKKMRWNSLEHKHHWAGHTGKHLSRNEEKKSHDS